MTIALKRHKICVKPSRIQGLGVFEEVDIAPGEIIEECYALILKQCDELANYTYNIVQKGLEEHMAMPLGFGCIFNHSSVPNADYALDGETLYMVFTALKPIKAGEEIFVSYGDHWFAMRGIKIKQTSFAYQLKNLFFGEVWFRRMILVTTAIILFALLISG